MGLKAPLFAPLISAGAAVSVLFALITRCILRLEKQMKGSLNSNQVLYMVVKALVRSKNLTALTLNFCKTLRSRSRSKRFELRSKRFELRSILRSF